MNYQNIIVAVDMDPKSIQTLSQIKDLPLTKESRIHLVHVFELSFMTFDFLPVLQPSPENYWLIQKNFEEKLISVKSQLGLDFYPNVETKCLISENAKQEFLHYADKNNATLIVAASKEREGFKGLFESSFTGFLQRFSRANLLILRPEA